MYMNKKIFILYIHRFEPRARDLATSALTTELAFLIHKLWLLSRGGGVSGRHRKGVLTAHNWWSVEYETAASGTTQQYTGKNVKVLEVEGCCSSQVRILVVKASAPGFESPVTTKIFPWLFSRSL